MVRLIMFADRAELNYNKRPLQLLKNKVWQFIGCEELRLNVVSRRVEIIYFKFPQYLQV